MKTKHFLLPLLIVVFFNTMTASGQDIAARVMTFNIRLDNPEDGVNSWENRKKILTKNLIRISPDIFGMQEVLQGQLQYLSENLPDYGYVGAGREDGKTAGEYGPVFYKKELFMVLHWGTFWLSATPADTGSVGWDAALPRICTWVKFLDLVTDQDFIFINTHLDHMGDTARAESAKLILDFIENQTDRLPVILTGDFNCSPEEEPYRILTNSMNGIKDACLLANSSECGTGTFNGFGSEKDPKRIDMIFVKGAWKANSYEVPEIKEGEMFISDHWPVVVELKIKN